MYKHVDYVDKFDEWAGTKGNSQNTMTIRKNDVFINPTAKYKAGPFDTRPKIVYNNTIIA